MEQKTFYLTFSKDVFDCFEVGGIYHVGFNYKSGQINQVIVLKRYKDTKFKRLLNKIGFKLKINTVKVNPFPR
jgi:hypothetical protein